MRDKNINSVETIGILRGLIDAGKPIRCTIPPGYNHNMRSNSTAGKALLWPAQQEDYFPEQAKFMPDAIARGPANKCCATIRGYQVFHLRPNK